jgi:hypothetical protein
MLYFILFIVILFYIYENWQAFKIIISTYFQPQKKELFIDTLKSSNGYVPANYSDNSSHVLVPPPLQTNKLSNPLLALQEAKREKRLQAYNLAVTEYNNKLEALRKSGDITLQGILVLQGNLFPRYKLVMDVLHSKNFFKIAETPLIISQVVKTEEQQNPNRVTPYLQLIENLRLAGALSDDDILVLKYKIVKATNLAVFDFLAKDDIRIFTEDESEFIKSCMLEMQYITATGLETVKTMILPDASGVLEPISVEEEDTGTSLKLNEQDLLILKGKPVYTRMDISDAVINPTFDDSNDAPTNIVGEEMDEYILEDWQGVCSGSRCKDISSRIKAYCQRPWYECHSHIPEYGMKYYYS